MYNPILFSCNTCTCMPIHVFGCCQCLYMYMYVPLLTTPISTLQDSHHSRSQSPSHANHLLSYDQHSGLHTDSHGRYVHAVSITLSLISLPLSSLSFSPPSSSLSPSTPSHFPLSSLLPSLFLLTCTFISLLLMYFFLSM